MGLKYKEERKIFADAFRASREHLGYTRKTLAVILGYAATSGTKKIKDIETCYCDIPNEVREKMSDIVQNGAPEGSPKPDLIEARNAHYLKHRDK